MRQLVRILAVLCLSVPLFAAPAVEQLIREHKAPKLGETKSVTGFNVSVGHASFTLPSGTVSVVLAGDKPVGLFLNGAGTFTYETVHKDELSALRYNAKHGDLDLKTGAENAKIAEPFKSVLLRGNGFGEVAGAAATAPSAQLEELLQILSRQQFADPAEHALALHTLNAPNARFVRADINGNARPYVYLYDDAWTHDEALALLRRPTVRGGADASWLYTTPLSKQAIGRDNRDTAAPNVMLTEVDVALVNTDDDKATLTVTETIVPQRRALSALKFSLFDDYIYDIRKEPRHYNLRSVTDGAGNKLSFHHQRGSVVVGLAQPAPAGKPVRLTFEIDGNILHRPDQSNYWQLGIEPWFPMVEMNEQAFTYHALLKVKKPFVPFTSGKTIRREVEGDWNVLETKFDQPLSWVAILAGKYHFDEETRNGVTVRVASFITKNERAFKQLRSIAFAAIEHYPTFLGPFPFEEINILEMNDLGYGQAPAGIVFITKEAFTPLLGEANAYVELVNMRLAHEMAHQYWGEVVKMASYEDQWIDEAFSEYSAALFMKAAKRQADYNKSFAYWKAGAGDGNKVSIIPMANRLFNPTDPYTRYAARTGLIYGKGAYLLAALHRELGDQMFLTFMKSMQKSFRWKTATTKDVIGLLNFMTKKDYAPWFEQYFYGTAMPEVPKK
jgi:Peptidase family M1 domain